MQTEGRQVQPLIQSVNKIGTSSVYSIYGIVSMCSYDFLPTVIRSARIRLYGFVTEAMRALNVKQLQRRARLSLHSYRFEEFMAIDADDMEPILPEIRV